MEYWLYFGVQWVPNVYPFLLSGDWLLGAVFQPIFSWSDIRVDVILFHLLSSSKHVRLGNFYSFPSFIGVAILVPSDATDNWKTPSAGGGKLTRVGALVIYFFEISTTCY